MVLPCVHVDRMSTLNGSLLARGTFLSANGFLPWAEGWMGTLILSGCETYNLNTSDSNNIHISVNIYIAYDYFMKF